MNQLVLLGPEIFLSAVALALLLGETVWDAKNKIWIHLSIAALVLVAIHQLYFFCAKVFWGADLAGLAPVAVNGQWIQYAPVFGMVSVDSLAVFFKIAVVVVGIMVFWLSTSYPEYENAPLGLYAAMLLLATVGMMILVSSTDLLMAVIGLELLSITSFILTGFSLGRRSSSEAAIKFFLVGTFSTSILLFGLSYYYGYFGTTSMNALLTFPLSGQKPDMILSFILILLLSGIGFKLAMVPFHMWAPDAYEGAPTPITAFLSVGPKAAAVGFIMRLLGQHASLNLTPLLAVLAAITMTVGNLGALHQTNLKRLLAYSSIAQVGYILVAFVAGGSLGSQAAMIYTFLYIFMNVGVFAALVIVSNQTRSDEISAFSGLSGRSLGLSLALVVFLLSLTGIPPMAGFVGKFTIFAAVINHPHLLWLGVVAVINSVISLYYYFRIVHQMFFREAESTAPAALRFSPALLCCLGISLVVTVIAGVIPNPLIDWVRLMVGS